MEFLSQYIYSLLAIAILLVFSAFFSGSETAIFSLTAYERSLLKRHPRIYYLLGVLLSRSEELLMVILLSNLAVNILIFTISGIIVYGAIKQGFELFASYVSIGSLLVVIIFGEVLPKAIAYNLRMRVVGFIVPILWLLHRLLFPIVKVMLYIFIIPSVRLIVAGRREPELTKEELMEIIDIADQEGIIRSIEGSLLRRLLDIRDRRISYVMTRRIDIVGFDLGEKLLLKEVKGRLSKARVRYFVIYEGNIDNLIGIVETKRVLVGSFNNHMNGSIADSGKDDNYRNNKTDDIRDYIRSIARPPIFVPEYQRIDQLIDFMRSNGIDVVVVVDEYGGVVGLVDLEDIYEILLGKLLRGFPSEPFIILRSDGRYLVNGRCPFGEFAKRFGLEKEGKEKKVEEPRDAIQTVAGWVMHLKGYLPEEGEKIDYGGLRIIVDKVQDNHVETLIVERKL